MAKLYFRYGTMDSAKSMNLLAVAHNYRKQGKRVLLVKPKLDVRFGSDKISSRSGLEAQADLLIEVGSWVNLPDYFTHTGGAEPRNPDLSVYLYASILAQAENLGLSQMANIAHLSYEKLAWCTRWYIREETVLFVLS